MLAALSSLSFSGIDAVISFKLFRKVIPAAPPGEINVTCDESLGHKVPFWDEMTVFGTKISARGVSSHGDYDYICKVKM